MPSKPLTEAAVKILLQLAELGDRQATEYLDRHPIDAESLSDETLKQLLPWLCSVDLGTAIRCAAFGRDDGP